MSKFSEQHDAFVTDGKSAIEIIKKMKSSAMQLDNTEASEALYQAIQNLELAASKMTKQKMDN